MPFKSLSQLRRFFAMEARGELPKGTAKRWLKETPNVSELPARVKDKERKREAIRRGLERGRKK